MTGMACVAFSTFVLEVDHKRNNLAVGTISFVSPNLNTTKDFTVLIPNPRRERLFNGAIRSSDPIRPDVVAYVKFSYRITDRHTEQSGGTGANRKFASRGYVMNLNVQRTSIREFPIRKDETGFFHGSFPHFGDYVIEHRFNSLDLNNLQDEAFEYFLTVFPSAAHDQRNDYINAGVISMDNDAG